MAKRVRDIESACRDTNNMERYEKLAMMIKVTRVREAKIRRRKGSGLACGVTVGRTEDRPSPLDETVSLGLPMGRLKFACSEEHKT